MVEIKEMTDEMQKISMQLQKLFTIHNYKISPSMLEFGSFLIKMPLIRNNFITLSS